MRFRLVENLDYDKIIDGLASYKMLWNILEEARDNTIQDSNLIRTFKTKGRMDLRGIKLNSSTDVVFLSKLFRDNRFETFRILYIKDNVIVGHECITAKTPGSTQTYKKPTLSSQDIEDELEHCKKQLIRFDADGYFLCHNHPGGNVGDVSDEDEEVTKTYSQSVPGFLGHIIVGIDKVSIMDKNLNINTFSIDDIPVYKTNFNVKNIKDFCMSYVQHNFTTVVYLSSNNQVVEFQRIKNSEFNDENIFKYINKQKQQNGATQCYLATDNVKIEKAAEWAVYYRLIDDCYFEREDEKVVSSSKLETLPKSIADEYRNSNPINYDALGKLKTKETIIHG